MKRIISIFLSVAMLFSVLSVVSFARADDYDMRKPTMLYVAQVKSNFVYLEWEAVYMDKERTFVIDQKVDGEWKSCNYEAEHGMDWYRGYVYNLKPAKQYIFRVREYVDIDGSRYYGEGTSIKVVTRPYKPVIKAPSTNNKHRVTAKWSKVSPCTGYQIQISKKKSFSKSAIVSTKTVSHKYGSCVFKKLKKGQKYYVRVRAYKTVNGHKHYSFWSSKKSIICK